jgi:hypothetical protein
LKIYASCIVSSLVKGEWKMKVDDNTAKADRLRQARALDGRFKRAAKAARALKLSEPTYQAHENATRGITTKSARVYADFYGVNLEWLLTGRGTPNEQLAPIVGLVGVGGEISVPVGFPSNQTEPQPRGRADCVAARIHGDAQFPLRHGWVIFWAHKGKGVPESCIGHLCVAKIKDGPMVLKEIRRGRNGKFDLLTWNAAPRENVALEWAALVVEIRPK